MYKIELTKSVNGLPFDSSRQKVHQTFGKPIKSFRKSPLSKSYTDDYGAFHVYYTPDNQMEAVEFFSGAELELFGKPLPWDYGMIKTWLLQLDPKAEADAVGITAPSYGVSMYGPNGKAETLLFATADYFAL